MTWLKPPPPDRSALAFAPRSNGAQAYRALAEGDQTWRKSVNRNSPLSRTDLLGGENQAIQRLIGAHARTQLANVHIADIDPNPFNPRQVIEVTELVESMREHGFIGALDGRLQAAVCNWPMAHAAWPPPKPPASSKSPSISMPIGMTTPC
ncbi:hypothetical protein [Candidatus Amarolinea dominans]|uniref:hypothetical protein n=1 Tax=Candidatus Amarolinea dominans TaxID=3140696 RepID=UPI0031CCB77E